MAHRSFWVICDKAQKPSWIIYQKNLKIQSWKFILILKMFQINFKILSSQRDKSIIWPNLLISLGKIFDKNNRFSMHRKYKENLFKILRSGYCDAIILQGDKLSEFNTDSLSKLGTFYNQS